MPTEPKILSKISHLWENKKKKSRYLDKKKLEENIHANCIRKIAKTKKFKSTYMVFERAEESLKP